MLYSDFAYLWPPRPEKSISPDLLKSLEGRMVLQTKKNGTCSVIFVSPDKKITAMNRHNEDHKLWSPTPQVMESFRALPGKGWYVFVAELLHSKVPGIRDVNYVHDVLVSDGHYLVGKTQSERQDILFDLLETEDMEETDTHFVVNENLWLPVEYETGFRQFFDQLISPEDEGIVLKDPNSKLKICSRAGSNVGGMVKCRKPHKNFTF